MGFRTAFVLASLGLSSLGSTCNEQSKGTDPAKDTQAATTGADVKLDGVDISALTPRERRDWSTYVSEFLAPCASTPVPIAQCVQEKRNCSSCISAARYVLRGVRDGLPRDAIEKSYKNRFDPAKVKNVPIEDSPVKGPESAPITVVEFADFECPHCGMMFPVLEKAYEEHKGKVRFSYKYMPIQSHAHAEIAARAAIAAHKQGKFWEMHKKLFENQNHLEQSDLDGYAKDIGLNIDKFHSEMRSKETDEKLAKDKKLSDALDVKATPTVFINGREYDGRQDFAEWFAMELGESGKAPAPPTSASAAPSGATSAQAVDAGRK